MNKQILLLSVAVAALGGSPAFAVDSPDWTDITTALTVPVDTAHATPGDPDGTPGDILLDTGGSITVTLGGPAVTINSDNAFKQVAGTTISNKNTADATGILVDLTTVDRNATLCTGSDDCFFGITDAGAIDLSGTGDNKKGLWLQGAVDDGTGTQTPFAFIGDVDMTGSTITITGDSSTGVQIDSLADLHGDLTLGTITMKTSSSTSTLGLTGFGLDGDVYGDIVSSGIITVAGTNTSEAGQIVGMKLAGEIFGNLTINAATSINVVGLGAEGIVLTGDLNPCDGTVTTDCGVASLGALINKGSINAGGFPGSPTAATGNPTSGNALAIGGNIAGGIYNAGPAFQGDTTVSGILTTEGPAEVVLIAPTVGGGTDAKPLLIGIYTGDTFDPGFSFYNRGAIANTSVNFGDSSHGIVVAGASTDNMTTLTGGIYNSGTIHAAASTSDSITGGVEAIAVHVKAYGVVGPNDTYTFNEGTGNFDYGNGASKFFAIDQAALVNSAAFGNGQIIATIAGPNGGSARAILIDNFGVLPSIINTGTISAIATTSDTSINLLSAEAIVDGSGTLTYIQNNGLISAVATTLDDDSQQSVAIDLSGDGTGTKAAAGVKILNQATADTTATIIGDILFGEGQHQIVDVEGASTDHKASIIGDISYGGGSNPGSDQLTIGDFATVTGTITADAALGVDVDIKSGGTLNLTNDAIALNAYDFHVETGGALNITVKESFNTGMISAIDTGNANAVLFDPGAKLNITYGSFVPNDSTFVLISAPNGEINMTTNLDTYNAQLAQDRPFLFDSAVLSVDTSDATKDELILKVEPKDAAELGLTGYAAQILPFANQALSNDDTLGAAFVAGITDQKTAQLAYTQMAPNVSGGERAIAIALTDQSSGPVAARQRILRMYGKASGETTLWGEEFAEFVQDPGDRSTGQTGFKDHGFGFVLGLDGGDPKGGWYGGAFSFYSGDIVEPLPRDSHTNTLWYMLTGYTDWRGKGLFLDTKFDIGYMDLKGKRFIDLTIPNVSGSGSSKFIDEADSKRPGIVGALGLTTGAVLAYGSTVITPQISIDGMTMREEGYTETHATSSSTTGNGKGLLLQAQALYASSARIFIGTEIREDLNFGDFFVQPDIRLGYRYDFLNDPTKLKVNFADVGSNSTPTGGPVFTVIGPDPAQGNFVAGASLATTTDAWTLGANFDFVRGTNGATTEVGTIHLLGRI